MKRPPAWVWIGLGVGFLVGSILAVVIYIKLKDIVEYFVGP